VAVPEIARHPNSSTGAKRAESPVNLAPKFGKIAVNAYIKAMFVV
jgi:hypothetical protein